MIYNARVISDEKEGLSDICITDDGCGDGCEGCVGCSKKTAHRSVPAVNTIGAKNGQNVIVEVSTGSVVLSGFMVLLLPVLLSVSGYAVGKYIFYNIPLAIVLLLAGLSVGILSCYFLNKKYTSKSSTLYRIISTDNDCE